jgi:hypothetical protein
MELLELGIEFEFNKFVALLLAFAITASRALALSESELLLPSCTAGFPLVLVLLLPLLLDPNAKPELPLLLAQALLLRSRALIEALRVGLARDGSFEVTEVPPFALLFPCCLFCFHSASCSMRDFLRARSSFVDPMDPFADPFAGPAAEDDDADDAGGCIVRFSFTAFRGETIVYGSVLNL